MHDPEVQHLLSLPPRMAERFAELERRPAPSWYAGSDPVGRPLGSGGGTAHLLVEAWRATGDGLSWEEWLGSSRKLVMHAGGQSRRLPANAATGKALMPCPVFRWGRGQRLEQTLLDVQLPDYRRLLKHAPDGYVAMIASGDVLLRFAAELPPFPAVDVLGLGMWTTPPQAKDFGVFFTPRKRPTELAFFLQKPTPERIGALASEHLFLVDTGMWLLSERALAVLLRRCGWEAGEARFRNGAPDPYEFYAEFALSLGTRPARPDPEIGALTAAVVPLPESEFHHFGTSRQMIESFTALQNRELDQTRLGRPGGAWHPDQYLMNARLDRPVDREANQTLWIENAVVPGSWQLGRDHVLTGVPENDWPVRLESGTCLDFVPVGATGWCVRYYGIDDRFGGAIGAEETRWLGRPAADWFAKRGLMPENPGEDVQLAALFPVLEASEIDGPFLEWLFRREPPASPAHAARWREARRLSARQVQAEVDLGRLYAQRSALRGAALVVLLRHRHWSIFYRLDLDRTAEAYAGLEAGLPPEDASPEEPLQRVHQTIFRSAVLRHRRAPGWEAEEQRAFAGLREIIVREAQLVPVEPRAGIVDDQIVWARSPVRFDLAGGWTDTPPYCLEHGGQVVNLAVDLNGQPPMQVFARLCPRPEIVLRSIDLGVEERVRTYEELAGFAEPGSAFALAKAACALAGFLPRFHAGNGYSSLAAQLAEFGGGLELSLVSAVPKGSGLGTSSILASTVLAALGEVCGLKWDRATLFQRTLALEQMITTGGGWQDQAGGLFPGLKLVETEPGLVQVPRVRWLPASLFGPDYANRRILLYYTGLTRMARGILTEIVRGIFLNSPEHLAVLQEIGASAHSTALALERCDYEGLVGAIGNTWRLKQKLDRGTCPPEVQAILDAAGPDLAAAKLPGAGGGGYLLLLARDDDAGLRIRRRLTERPPNPRARFVEFGVSNTGLQVTRS